MAKAAARNWKGMLIPIVVMLLFWGIAIAMWRSTGYVQPLVVFGYIGAAIGFGLGLYALLPKRRKPLGRRFALLLVGAFLLAFAATIGGENAQLEGFFFGLLAGVYQMAVIHYMIAKLIGPMLFGRLWCGWACWTVMVLDLLPFRRSTGRLPGKWGWLRYAHFLVGMGLVGVLWFGFDYNLGATGPTAVYWFLMGNALYYAAGVVLAFALKDNRAFCKYLCPVSVPLKITSRLSLLKIGTTGKECNGCGACTKMCPMDIRIPDYISKGQRVLSTECSLCQTCITACARDSLKLSFGFDLGGKDLLRERTSKPELGTRAFAPRPANERAWNNPKL